MTFEETVHELLDFTDSPAAKFMGPSIENYKQRISELANDCRELAKDLPIEVTQERVALVRESLDYLRRYYLENPIGEGLVCFVRGYVLLVSNWNSHTVKREEIAEQVVLLDRLYDGHLTSLEAIATVKKLIQQMRRYSNFALPSIELSKHYMKTLEE
jgi:hypothetical protein